MYYNFGANYFIDYYYLFHWEDSISDLVPQLKKLSQ